MNKENSTKKSKNVVVRSPYMTRSREVSKTVKEVEQKKIVSKPRNHTTAKKSQQQNTTQQISSKQDGVSIDSLNSDSLEIIFQHVGVYDTFWNARRVCKRWNEIVKKDNLAMSFVKMNDWNEDLAICVKRNDHQTPYEHCLQRVAVSKFYEKAFSLFEKVIPYKQKKYEERPSRETIQAQWEKMAKSAKHPENKTKKVVMTMPWQYMEFVKIFNGLSLSGAGYKLLSKCGKYFYDWCQEGQLVENIHPTKDTEDSAAWLYIGGNVDVYYEIVMCCDKDHPDFGVLSHWSNNCNDMKLLANSFLELIRGMYFSLALFMEKFNMDAAKLRWILNSEEVDQGNLHEFTYPGRWLVDGKANTDIPYTQEDVDAEIQELEELEQENGSDDEEEGSNDDSCGESGCEDESEDENEDEDD